MIPGRGETERARREQLKIALASALPLPPNIGCAPERGSIIETVHRYERTKNRLSSSRDDVPFAWSGPAIGWSPGGTAKLQSIRVGRHCGLGSVLVERRCGH